jgi:hypothetical protein
MATDLDQLSALIQRAGKAAGSEYKLAKLLHVDQPTLSAWRTGRRNCVPADRARLAGFAGDDPVQELVRATIAQTKNKTRKEQLSALLGKSLRLTGAVPVFALSALATSGDYFTRCIESLIRVSTVDRSRMLARKEKPVLKPA